jgi:hypothetical protein
MAASDPSRGTSGVAATLWEIREKTGKMLGLDSRNAGLGARVASLRDRLPADLRETPGPVFDALAFTSVYQLDDEWAAEIANRTVHAVMHLSWVPDGADGYRGQLAVLVKPNGPIGAAYMNAIKPLRYRIVYPAMIRRIGRDWQRRQENPSSPTA